MSRLRLNIFLDVFKSMFILKKNIKLNFFNVFLLILIC
jgi:hypothetical protein